VTSAPEGKTCTTDGETTCVVTGLTNGTAYTFSVVATNAVGNSSAAQSGSVTLATVPDAPTEVTVERGDKQVTVSWSAPADNDSAITSYTVTSAPQGKTCITNGETTCVVTGLTNGTAYTFSVVATNSVGDGPAAQTESVIPAAVPDAPTEVTVERGEGQVTVSWTAPTETGGSDITGYTVTASSDNATCATTDATTCTVEGLTNGTEYTFSVVATNAVGDSPASAASAKVIPVGPPSEPLDIMVEARVGGLLVSWTAPLDDGGSTIVRYVARANPSCEVTARPDEVLGVTRYSCEIQGLSPAEYYAVFVSAINETGLSAEIAAVVGEGEQAAAEIFSPLPALPVPVNRPLFLLLLALMMFGLVAPLLRRVSP